MKNGANVGVRLRLVDLVIDVDRRDFHEGETLRTDNPLHRLCAAIGLNLESYPLAFIVGPVVLLGIDQVL